MSLPEKQTTVNLNSASFVVIMLLHEGLTYICACPINESMFDGHTRL